MQRDARGMESAFGLARVDDERELCAYPHPGETLHPLCGSRLCRSPDPRATSAEVAQSPL